MNTLDFPVRLLERGTDDICILVPHESLIYYKDEAGRASRNNTRKFCNWIRGQFAHVPTEFRFVNTKRVTYKGRRWYSSNRYATVGCDKHFVAYGLTRSELMMIKLAWQFQTQPCRLKGTSHPDPNAFAVDAPQGFRPSDALAKRLARETKAKKVRQV